MKHLISLLMLTLSLPVSADEQQLLDLLRVKQADSETTRLAINAGSERALLCKYCHGEDGNSVKSSIPNLASQNVTYLIRQFELFARGERSNKTMNQIAKLLTTDEKVNIALYYASQQVKQQTPYRPELAQQGERLFSTKCFFCHGKDGYGKEDTPYIAGQPSEYILRTLGSYNSTVVKRAETAMSRVARTLSNADIEALAAYLSTLR